MFLGEQSPTNGLSDKRSEVRTGFGMNGLGTLLATPLLFI